MRITREYLESFIGKNVQIIFIDNDVCVGVLKKGLVGAENAQKWYSIDHLSFRLSHIKNIKEV